MIEFYQGQEIILSQQAKTNNGVILDLTNAVVTTTISDSSGGSSYIITKSSTDSSQINIISATNGLYKIIINSIESNYLSKGRWIVKSSIVISTHTYIVENTIYIKETANDTYTIYTIENAKSLTYTELSNLITNDDLIVGGQYLITDFTDGDNEGLLVTAKSADELNSIANVVGDTDNYVYNVSTNTVTSLSKVIESLENKTIDFSDNNVINQIEVTYEQLTTLIASNGLKKGNKYLITDFQETWTGGSKTAEQIIVTASSPNTLERVAASVTNPSDYIEYTVVKTLIAGATKGVILKRVDNYKNEFNINYNNTFTMWGYNTYDNIFRCKLYNNNINNTTSGNILTCERFNQNTLSNNFKNNLFKSNDVYNNTFGSGFLNNVFLGGVNSNIFGQYCYYNNLGNNFNNNTIGQYFQYNNIGSGFSGNTLGTYFMYNVFGNSCYSNNIDNSQYNNIGNNFHDNDFADSFYSNKIKDNFYNNDIDGSFEKNEIEDGCYQNHFQGSFINNKIGKECTSCVFGSGYQHNIFDESIFINPVQFDDIYEWQVHLQASYTCKIYRNSAGILYLEYTNSDGQTVTLTAE